MRGYHAYVFVTNSRKSRIILKQNMNSETDLLNTAGCQSDAMRQRRSNRVVNLGLAANALLAVVKISAGIFGHSKALLAIIGAFVITTGIAIFWDSINSAFDMISGRRERNPVESFTLIVALATVCVKIYLMINAAAVGRTTQNLAVSALAKDHRNDIFASLGAAAGIVLGLLGIQWGDPLAGALVAIVVAKTGIDILRESTAELMDTVPGSEMNNKIRSIIASNSAVKSVESIHTHRFGPYYMANITVGIDGNLSVLEGDRIADSIEKLLYEKIELLRRVYIHYHPPKRRGKRKP